MNKRDCYFIGIVLTSIYFLIGCQKKNKASFLSLKTLSPIVMESNGAEIFQYWEFKNDDLLWNNNESELVNLKFYKDSLEKLLGKDSFKLLVQKVALQDISYQSINTLNGDSINAQLIHSKAIGKIRPINFLEAQILDYQLSRYPLLSHPTEFHAFILNNESSNLVRIYFAASDQPWPPKPIVILAAIKNDLNKGWTLNYHLHNHYEPKNNNYIGILAPSTTDAQYFLFLSEEYNLKNALITNGLHTVEIKSKEFQKFKTPENN